MSSEMIIHFKSISKKFSDVRVLNDIDFSINKGEVHALMGENGAGKSTLLRILAGELVNFTGDVEIDGKKVNFHRPIDAINAGISFVHQELNLCNNMNVIRNIFLGKENLFSKKEQKEKTKKLLEELNLNINLDVPIMHYNVATRQMIEIAKSTLGNFRILILDEPTSALNSEETESMFTLLDELKEKGVTIIYVSHKINEVMRIADRITVLRDGCYINTVNKSKTNEKEIVKMMVGREVSQERVAKNKSVGEAVLSVKNYNLNNVFSNVEFSLHRGEVLGIAGLEGTGRYEIVRSLFGMIPGAKGEVELFGKSIRFTHPSQAIKHDISLVAGERKEEGIFRLFDVGYNVGIAYTYDKWFYKGSNLYDFAEKFVDKIGVKYSSLKQEIVNLSGGNQQKAILSRVISKNPKIVFLEEPTRGIDVGAKSEIYNIIREMAENGTSFIIVSSELEEMQVNCDRILVMQRGGLCGGILDAVTSTQNDIMELATGVTELH